MEKCGTKRGEKTLSEERDSETLKLSILRQRGVGRIIIAKDKLEEKIQKHNNLNIESLLGYMMKIKKLRELLKEAK